MGSTFYPGFDPLGALGLPDGTHSTIRPGVILPHGLLAALLSQAGRPRDGTCSGRYPFVCLSLDIPGESRLSQVTPAALRGRSGYSRVRRTNRVCLNLRRLPFPPVLSGWGLKPGVRGQSPRRTLRPPAAAPRATGARDRPGRHAASPRQSPTTSASTPRWPVCGVFSNRRRHARKTHATAD